MADVQIVTVTLSDGTPVQVIAGTPLHDWYLALAARTSTVTATSPDIDLSTLRVMAWFMTPHGPQSVVEPATIEEFRRRDYLELTDQQAADFFAGAVEIPDVSFITGQELAAALGATDTPPNPRVRPVWLSNSLKHLTASPDAAARFEIIPGSGSVYQEPSVWYANGRYNMVFTTGGYLAYASCTADPMKPQDWSTPIPLIGVAAGNYSGPGTPARANVSIFGSTIYYYFTDVASNDAHVATAPLANPTSVTVQADIVMPLPSGSGLLGNLCVVHDEGAGLYRMFYEVATSVPANVGGQVNTWAIGMATCATPTGTFVPQINHIESLRPGGFGSASGPTIFREGSEWVMYLHSQEWAQSAPDNVYRAVTTDLATNSWTVLDDGAPVIRRAHRAEADQCADPALCQGPEGTWFAFWTGYNNRTQVASIMGTPMLPSLRQWDGQGWQPAERGLTKASELPEAGPWRVECGKPWIWTDYADKVGGWTQDGNSGGRYFTGSQGNSISYDVALAPGTYTLTVATRTGPNQADITAELDSGGGYWTLPVLGVLSCYSATEVSPVYLSLDFTLYGSETMRRLLRFSALSKDALSSAYFLELQEWSIKRTA